MVILYRVVPTFAHHPVRTGRDGQRVVAVDSGLVNQPCCVVKFDEKFVPVDEDIELMVGLHDVVVSGLGVSDDLTENGGSAPNNTLGVRTRRTSPWRTISLISEFLRRAAAVSVVRAADRNAGVRRRGRSSPSSAICRPKDRLSRAWHRRKSDGQSTDGLRRPHERHNDPTR